MRKRLIAVLVYALVFGPTLRAQFISHDRLTGLTPPVFNGSDQFAGSSLDSTNWAMLDRQGDLSNSELQCYKPANVAVTGGELVITAQVQSVTCNSNNYSYTSGMVQWRSLSFTYGTIEVRAKMTGGTGPWPSIWLLGANCQVTNLTTADNTGTCNWDAAGSDEIDFIEILASSTTQVNEQIHTGGNNPGCTGSTGDVRQYHTYKLVWAAGDLQWFIDGSLQCHKTSFVPSTPMFLIVNVAMGGAGGSVSNGTLPVTMNVDYVTVTQP